jgi:hypothetical protein
MIDYRFRKLFILWESREELFFVLCFISLQQKNIKYKNHIPPLPISIPNIVNGK